MGFVHRNLKPSNFLIAQLSRLDREGFKYLVKVSDFRMSKHLGKQPNHSGQRGSDGWISPYPPKNYPQEIKTHPSEDVFILGCFFHYVLTNGKHPFGDNGIERELNVKKHDYEVYLAKWKPEIEEIQAISLVKDMIKYDPEERPALKTILGRAYFLPDDYYKLYDLQAEVKPGLCVIFNQETFDNVKMFYLLTKSNYYFKIVI
jgi:serine/threonine-protein kinase/endoribonuclease IRE1